MNGCFSCRRADHQHIQTWSILAAEGIDQHHSCIMRLHNLPKLGHDHNQLTPPSSNNLKARQTKQNLPNLCSYAGRKNSIAEHAKGHPQKRRSLAQGCHWHLRYVQKRRNWYTEATQSTHIHAGTEHEPNDTITRTPLNEASGISCKAGKLSMHLRVSATAASIFPLLSFGQVSPIPNHTSKIAHMLARGRARARPQPLNNTTSTITMSP